MAATVEDAAEGLFRRSARHGAALLRDGDVGSQSQILAATGVAVVDLADKSIPLVSAADDIGTFGRTLAIETGDGEVGAL